MASAQRDRKSKRTNVERERTPSPLWQRLIFSGPFVGWLFFAILFAYALLTFGAAEYMGVKDSGVTRELVKNFHGEIVRRQLEMAGLASAIGEPGGSRPEARAPTSLPATPGG